MEIFNIVLLAISGLLLSVVGTLRLSNPIKNYLKNSGITLAQDVHLLSEMRGVSAVMLMGGLLILAGIFIPKLMVASFLVAVLLFLGFAVGRIIGLKVDGKPNQLILQGLVSEIVLGAANVYCLVSLLME